MSNLGVKGSLQLDTATFKVWLASVVRFISSMSMNSLSN